MYSFIPAVMVSGKTSVPTGYGAVLFKKSAIPGRVPTTGELQWGEIALNVNDSKLFIKDINNTIRLLAQADKSAFAGGRLTLSSTLPIGIDIAGATTLYYLPYTSNSILLYNNNSANYEFVPLPTSGLGLGGLLSNTIYDVFIANNLYGASSIALGLAWTNDTTRATTLYNVNGMYFLGSSPSQMVYRYVGTIRTIASGQTEDSAQNRYVWNHYNRLPRLMTTWSPTAGYNWTCPTNAGAATWTWQPCNYAGGYDNVTHPYALYLNFLIGDSIGITFDMYGLYANRTDITPASIAAMNAVSLNQTGSWANAISCGYTALVAIVSGCIPATIYATVGRSWIIGLDGLAVNTGVTATGTFWPQELNTSIMM